MGTIELEAGRRRRRRDVRNATLAVLGVAGILSVMVIAPNVFKALGKSGLLTKLKYQMGGILTRLKARGEIEFVERNGKKFVRLTEKGERALALQQARLGLHSAKKRRWDGRYRLVIFDVPERRKRVRELLRFEMREIGFLRIQDSVWLYPYGCEEFVALLKADLHIGKDVLYAIVEDMENDSWIRKHFGLPAR